MYCQQSHQAECMMVLAIWLVGLEQQARLLHTIVLLAMPNRQQSNEYTAKPEKQNETAFDFIVDPKLHLFPSLSASFLLSFSPHSPTCVHDA